MDVFACCTIFSSRVLFTFSPVLLPHLRWARGHLHDVWCCVRKMSGSESGDVKQLQRSSAPRLRRGNSRFRRRKRVAENRGEEDVMTFTMTHSK